MKVNKNVEEVLYKEMLNLLLKWPDKVSRKDSCVNTKFSHPPVWVILRQNSDNIALHETQLVRLLSLVVVQCNSLAKCTTTSYNHSTIRWTCISLNNAFSQTRQHFLAVIAVHFILSIGLKHLPLQFQLAERCHCWQSHVDQIIIPQQTFLNQHNSA